MNTSLISKKMKKVIILLLFCNVLMLQTKGESHFFKSQYINLSYFFLNDDNNDESNRIWVHNHYFFGKIGFSVTKSFYTGFIANGIITKSNMWAKDNERFFLGGIYAQYFVINRPVFKLFGEGSLSYGDYNVSAKYNESSKEKGLFYLGITGGAKLRLFVDRLYITASYTWQPTISKIKEFNNPHISYYTLNTFNLGICYYTDLQIKRKLKKTKNTWKCD